MNADRRDGAGADIVDNASDTGSTAAPTGKLISLAEWVALHYTPTSAPCTNTVRRWIRANRIHPKPQKQGRAYYFSPQAKYIAE